MTETIEITTLEDEAVEIEVEELSVLGQMRWGAKAPDAIRGPPHEMKMTPDVLDFLIELVESQTILTRELLNELGHQQLNKVFNRVVSISFNGDRVNDDEIHDFSEGIDSGNNASENLDDWR